MSISIFPKHLSPYYTYWVVYCWCDCGSESAICENCVKEHSIREKRIVTKNCWTCKTVIRIQMEEEFKKFYIRKLVGEVNNQIKKEGKKKSFFFTVFMLKL